MIQIRIERKPVTGAILSFRIKGHALYADPGNDIVCSAISAITVGTVNAIEKLTGTVANARMKDGFLSARYSPELFEPGNEKGQQVQLLLESMVVMLRGIEESYGKHIAITQNPRKKEVDPNVET
ncbi:ribosomal-processing cysteine protease Prp [Gorillibacterium timonense]|uniref:ribosomal-processing cysteine protease Prp n=1 Tax=Gorillibacterium timonense TaxID=1689269 RepID=UPI00071DCC70|nr:ribosomal-processing cysteine protease Prp [Gorillibacterium timonense]